MRTCNILDMIHDRLKCNAVPISASRFEARGLIDLVEMKAYIYGDDMEQGISVDIPDGMKTGRVMCEDAGIRLRAGLMKTTSVSRELTIERKRAIRVNASRRNDVLYLYAVPAE